MSALHGDLNLGDVLGAAGLDPAELVVIRHTYRPDQPDGLASRADVTAERVWAYTRRQSKDTRTFPANPPKLWLVFIRDGGSRSRFFGAYENRGEVGDIDDIHRYFDLVESEALASLRDRLVIDWGRAAIRWWMKGSTAATMPLVEIADLASVDFPGFGDLELDYTELVEMVEDRRYAAWRAALSEVNGIYSIADRETGKLYVGKADGVDGILGRWRQYAADGHGGNKLLVELGRLNPEHRRHFVFSVLRVFDKNAAPSEVDAAESHFKRVLLTREFGNNDN